MDCRAGENMAEALHSETRCFGVGGRHFGVLFAFRHICEQRLLKPGTPFSYLAVKQLARPHQHVCVSSSSFRMNTFHN